MEKSLEFFKTKTILITLLNIYVYSTSCMLNELQDREGAGTAVLPGQARINVFFFFLLFSRNK